ncbi:MAG: hypothetical protein D8M59_10860 [Planctomycetes bacterium]|nr:hypothetical protein [Planctomycetota bacterium]NOG54150.1 hypothetical protein [Planctomycetota bacterium]
MYVTPTYRKLRQAGLCSNFQRIRTGTLRESVANYAELEVLLRDTCYATYLETQRAQVLVS